MTTTSPMTFPGLQFSDAVKQADELFAKGYDVEIHGPVWTAYREGGFSSFIITASKSS